MRACRPTALPLLAACAAFASVAAFAQLAVMPDSVDRAQRILAQARKEGEAARLRAERLEAEARRAGEKVEQTVREAAAIAARIQQAQAEIAAHEARIAMLGKERERLRARLAERELPLMRLTAGLQQLARRPPLFALLQPGSVQDMVHLRALLETMIPQVRRQTAALRSEIERGRLLALRAQAASARLREAKAELQARRKHLALIETRQRLESRKASGIASREAERALALAEKARNLDALVGQVARQGVLREQLARLAGPILRPPRPEQTGVILPDDFAAAAPELKGFMMPIAGRVVTGFGVATQGHLKSTGIMLVARPGAQAVAPAAGRVAFAGPFRGYGRIVIIEHGGGWTSLVTGLAQLDVEVGDRLVAGSPLGVAGPGEPLVTVELRRDGVPVNPLPFLRPL